ncbi:Hypothetical predicted protein, partial [Paramuricea clavata]
MEDGHAENSSDQSILDTTHDLLNSIADSNKEDTTTKWTSPGGRAKLCETQELAIRWYSDTSTLTFKGEKSNQAKAKLISIVKNRKESKANSSPPEYDGDLHTFDSINPLGLGCRKHSCSQAILHKMISELKWSSLWQQQRQKSMLYHRQLINNLKQDILPDVYVMALQNQIKMLKAENKQLREKNATASLAMSDLQTIVKELENEKKSLITAFKILQAEDKPDEVIQTKENRKQKRKQNQNSKQNSQLKQGRYSLLNVEDDDENITIDRRRASLSRTWLHAWFYWTQAQESQAQEFRTNDIVILDDSMIKYVNARKL